MKDAARRRMSFRRRRRTAPRPYAEPWRRLRNLLAAAPNLSTSPETSVIHSGRRRAELADTMHFGPDRGSGARRQDTRRPKVDSSVGARLLATGLVHRGASFGMTAVCACDAHPDVVSRRLVSTQEDRLRREVGQPSEIESTRGSGARRQDTSRPKVDSSAGARLLATGLVHRGASFGMTAVCACDFHQRRGRPQAGIDPGTQAVRLIRA
jgi:hypothetical protein